MKPADREESDRESKKEERKRWRKGNGEEEQQNQVRQSRGQGGEPLKPVTPGAQPAPFLFGTSVPEMSLGSRSAYLVGNA